MKLPTIPMPYLVAGGAVAAALLWAASRGAKETGQTIGATTVHLVDGVLSGGVIEGAKLFGLPATNMTECEKAKAEGRTLDASFKCPAKDFLSYLWN